MIKIPHQILLFAAFLLSNLEISSQTYNVRGVVRTMDSLDLTDKECRSCPVFLNDTLETITDNYGGFEFTNIPNGIHKLLIQTATYSRSYSVIIEDKDYYNDYTLLFNHEKYIAQAKSNIENNTPVLYELGSIAPVKITGEYGFNSFQNKFGPRVEIIGCVVDTDDETYLECNFLVFDWLTNLYGIEWRNGKWREMLKLIYGFSDWEKIHDYPTNHSVLNPNTPLIVIDGLIIDKIPNEGKPAITVNRDNAKTFVTRIFPIIQESDIDDISFIEVPPIGCRRPSGGIVIVRTNPESGVDTILLNGHISKRKNKVELTSFVTSKPPHFYLFEKKWGLNKITSLKIHSNGKEVLDDNNNKHIIFVEVNTK